MLYFYVSAFEKKATGENYRILDRDCEGMFQRGQFQLFNGYYCWTKHVAD